jgi:hypothetical protein
MDGGSFVSAGNPLSRMDHGEATVLATLARWDEYFYHSNKRLLIK